MDIPKIFTEIYAANTWGDAESRSGPGSSVFRTRLVRPALTRLFRELGIHSVLDLGCGDFNWMRLTDMDGVHYTGVDVVPEIVKSNVEQYSSAWRMFLCLNMVDAPLPPVDLILCRDALVHLSFADIFSALRHIRSSGARYLLTTTFDDVTENTDIETGGWRTLNVQLPPLSFPPPVGKLWDGPRADGTYADKMLALYQVADLPAL
ncbi:MAG TPA: class I SAM-dependent methyltransferase [Bryobacteraceae bacterium]|nr:class I SAM-dependent methyltransferase [Bryobacteraceae bacterium]